MSDDDPITTAIETAVADAGLSETTSEPAATTSEPAATTSEPASTATAPADDEQELVALQKELVEKTPTLRGRIDVARHQAVLTRERRKHEAALKSAQDAAAAALDPYKKFDLPEWQDRFKALEIAETNPRDFVNKILKHLPGYQEAFQEMVEAAATERGVSAKTIAAATPDDQMPEPDRIDQSDGTLSYSAEAARKLARWEARQATKDLETKLEAERSALKPILERHKADTELDNRKAYYSRVLADARQTWPGYAENEQAIATELRQPGNRETLDQAYRRVVFGKLSLAAKQAKVDEANIRSSAIAEHVEAVNKKSAMSSALVPGRMPAAAATDTPRDMEDIIREAMRSAA